MDLFEYMREQKKETESPLASRLRPTTLDEMVGQQHIIGKDKLLYRAIKADKLSSIILYGPPGTGKTTLAKVIANSTSAEFLQMNATSAGKKDMEDVIAKAKNNMGMFGKKTILFIDEIHRLNANVEEILYPAMEDYALDIIIGKGPSAHSIRLDLPPFTLVGATTRMGLLTSPLRDRFGIKEQLELYAPEDLQEIIQRSADILHIEIDAEGALEIASRSRGTPRIVNRLLKRVRDFAQVRGNGKIDLATAKAGLDMLAIDGQGLDAVDRRMLTTMIVKFGGRPVGLDTIAAATGEDATTIEDVYEPYLLQLGLIARTPRGRVVLPAGYAHMGMAPAGTNCAQQRLPVEP